MIKLVFTDGSSFILDDGRVLAAVEIASGRAVVGAVAHGGTPVALDRDGVPLKKNGERRAYAGRSPVPGTNKWKVLVALGQAPAPLTADLLGIPFHVATGLCTQLVRGGWIACTGHIGAKRAYRLTAKGNALLADNPAHRPAKQTPAHHTAKIAMPAGIEPRLGVESDCAIARELGVSAPTVARWRKAKGIDPAYKITRITKENP